MSVVIDDFLHFISEHDHQYRLGAIHVRFRVTHFKELGEGLYLMTTQNMFPEVKSKAPNGVSPTYWLT